MKNVAFTQMLEQRESLVRLLQESIGMIKTSIPVVGWIGSIVTGGLIILILAGTAAAQSRPVPAQPAARPPVQAKREITSLTGPGEVKLACQLQYQACYVKETADRAWQLRFAGVLPRGPGVHVLVFNEAGDLIHRGSVAYGEYTPQKPFIVTVPADGKAQQYVIKVIGQQDNIAGITLPLTNLPFEVYGESAFTFGAGHVAGLHPMAAFEITANTPAPHFDGWKGDYRILDDAGNTLLDSKDKRLPIGDPAKKGKETNVEMIATGLAPGTMYWLQPYGCGYVNVLNGKVYLTMQPDRWFEPKLTWSMAERQWWKGIVDVTAK